MIGKDEVPRPGKFPAGRDLHGIAIGGGVDE
jgi:hypothetical protein